MTHVLLIRFSALGDVTLLVPVVRAAAEQDPDVQFTVLSQMHLADLFADMPSNVHFHGVDTKRQSLHEISAGLGRYDLVADMHGVWRSLYVRWYMRLKGARVACIDKSRWSKRLLVLGKIHEPLKHTFERYADVLAALGLPIKAQVYPRILPIKEAGGIGIAPFAAHQGKVYPLERMECVVKMLSEKGEHVVLFGGGEKEKHILDRWAARYPNVENAAGRYSLHEELERMSRLRVMVSMDSANMHLASLAGIRVVSVWGATHPNAGFMGIGQNAQDCIQRELDCRPCSIYGNKKCKYGDYRCLEIAPEEIVARIG